MPGGLFLGMAAGAASGAWSLNNNIKQEGDRRTFGKKEWYPGKNIRDRYFFARDKRRKLMEEGLKDMEKGPDQNRVRQQTDLAATQGQQAIQQQQNALAGDMLGSGGLSNVSGRAATLQRELSKGAGAVGAQASAGAYQTESDRLMAKDAMMRQELYQQDLLETQRAQFIATMMFNAIKGGGTGGSFGAGMETALTNGLSSAAAGEAAGAGGAAGAAGATGATAGTVGAAEAAGTIALAGCWVAEELFGKYDVRTHLARYYARTTDSWFMRAYKKHGRAWAKWLKAHPSFKPVVKPIWMRMARLGAAKLQLSLA
jgi:hypothetical protein